MVAVPEEVSEATLLKLKTEARASRIKSEQTQEQALEFSKNAKQALG